MSKFTPGPWVVGWKGDGYTGVTGPRSVAGVWLDSHARDRTIVSAKYSGCPDSGKVVADILLTDEFAEADARLIAAAPEMAALLKDIVQSHDSSECDSDGGMALMVHADTARALLSRIEGGT